MDLKRRAVLDLIERNIDRPSVKIACSAGCTPRYVDMLKAELRERRTRAKLKNGGEPVFTVKKGILSADWHVPYHDPRAFETFLNFVIDYDPDIFIVNGDLWDCYGASFWRKDPKRLRLPDELAKVNELMDTVDEALPDAHKVLVAGNHEERMPSFLQSKAPELCGLESLEVPALLKLPVRGWEYVDNTDLLVHMQRPYHVGKLYIVHGHEIKVGFNAVNIPRLYYQKSMCPIVVAHHHCAQEYRQKKLDHTYACAWSLAGLCNLSADYMPVTNWGHGFATVEWDEDGDFAFRHRRISGSRIE